MFDENGLGILLATSTLFYIIGYNLGQQKSEENVVADMSLKGMQVVVTGANTGIGLGIGIYIYSVDYCHSV
jgi:hypothetical protein